MCATADEAARNSSIAPFSAQALCFASLKKTLASAMIEDASGLEPDYDLLPPSNFPSTADAAGVAALWTKLIDPDSR
jgi:hypothetical protein